MWAERRRGLILGGEGLSKEVEPMSWGPAWTRANEASGRCQRTIWRAKQTQEREERAARATAEIRRAAGAIAVV